MLDIMQKHKEKTKKEQIDYIKDDIKKHIESIKKTENLD